MYVIIVSLFVTTFIAMLIFWDGFRRWLARELDAQWQLLRLRWPGITAEITDLFITVRNILTVYGIIVVMLSLIALVLISFALLINVPAFTGIAFIFALTLVLIAWLPAGLVLRLFGSEMVLPRTLRVIVAWLAFLGFTAMAFPELINMKVLLGVALISFIILGITEKINVLDKIVAPAVVLMILLLAWQHFFPDGYRSTTRYASSWMKRMNTTKDRGSIINETEAATTYAVILRNIDNLYLLNDSNISVVESNLLKGTTVRLANHENEVFVYDGQGLIEIQLPRENGSFIGGDKYWVEAEFVALASPREIVPKTKLVSEVKKEVDVVVVHQPPKDSLFTPGVYFISVNGKTPFFINVVSGKECARYSLASQTVNGYVVQYDDGATVYDEPGRSVTFPHKERPRFRLVANTPTVVKMIVS